MSGTGVTGVEIGGPIKPIGGAQSHVFEDVDGWSGFRVVATTTERDAVYQDCQRVGMWVFCVADLTVYRLTATGTPGTYTAHSFGASAPGGTGFVKAASSTFSVVSSIDLSSDTGSSTLPASRLSGLTSAVNTIIAAYTSLTASQVSDFGTAVTARIAATAPTGNGFARYFSGVRNAAAQLIDLAADINTSTVLPAANGGGQVLYPSVTTSSSTPQLLASSPVIPNPGGADVFASVLFRDASANLFLQVIQGIYSNATGTVAGVYTPVAGAGNGTLLNCSVSLVINNTTKKIELYGTNTGGTSVTMTAEFTAKIG